MNILEILTDDFSHLPATEKQLIKKVNGTLINLMAKNEIKNNVILIVLIL